MYAYIWNRVKHLDDKIIELFENSDVYTQKIINLISILEGDRLFFEFVFEVYREKVILGANEISDFDLNVFFKNKEVQSEEVSKWVDNTKKRLGSLYCNFMMEANLLIFDNKKRIVKPIILDIELERYLIESGKQTLVKAIKGMS